MEHPTTFRSGRACIPLSAARTLTRTRATTVIGALAAASALHASCALAGAVPEEEALLLAEGSNGMVFSVQPSSIRPHLLGYQARIHGESAALGRLDGSDPRSAMFRSVESTWVFACHAGTFSIVLDRFLDGAGNTVAVFTESAYQQDAPEPGTVAATVLQRLCQYVGHGVATAKAGT